MNQTSKRLLTCIIALAVCFHFIWIAVYCFPQSSKSHRIDLISKLYVYPIFHQNWKLFVPAPDVHRQLFVRYKVNRKFTDWKDILDREVVHRKENRLIGNETKVLLFSNSLIYELNYLAKQTQQVFLTEPSNKEFAVLKFEVTRYLRSEFKINSNETYELLLVSERNKQSKAYYMKSLDIN